LIALERRPQSVLSWVLASLLVLKPPLLAAPGLTLLGRSQWRPLVGVVLLSALLLFVPFALVGFDQLSDFVMRMLGITGDGFRAEPKVSTPADEMQNWSGVVGRLLRNGPLLGPTLVLDAITVVLALKAVRDGSFREGWLASTIALLLVTPHVHFHFWLVLFAPGVAVYLERRSVMLAMALLGFHLALLLSMLFWDGGLLSGAWAPASLGLLVYLAFRDRVERLADVVGQRAESWRLRAAHSTCSSETATGAR
jgi:hypothetical protein